MSGKELWEEFKLSASEGLDGFKKEFSKAAEELERQGKIIKLRFDITVLRRKISEDFTNLGERVYTLIGAKKDIASDEEIVSYTSSISAHKKAILKAQKEIQKIKSLHNPTSRTEHHKKQARESAK